MRRKKLCALLCAAAFTLSAVGGLPVSAEPGGETVQVETYAESGDFSYETNATGITITGYTGSGGDVTIPEEIDGKKVTKIGDEAFDHCDNLTSVTIPEGVTEIGKSAFDCCYNLASVSIPNSVTTIGERAFCLAAITSVTIPNNVTSIGRGAFGRCENLTSILVDSDNNEFSSVSGILYSKDGRVLVQYPTGKKESQFVIPNTVTSIGYGAFMDCEALQVVTISDSVVSIGDSAFHGCLDLENVTIPSSVTSIGGHAFRDCESFTKIILPDSVTSIGKWAFYGCWELTEITIPNGVTLIDEHTFGGCFELASVTIPSSVTSIGESAFYGAAFTSMTIPSSVTEIGNGAFSYCSKLTSVTIPDSVTEIGDSAFTNCTNLTIYGYTGSRAETYANGKNIPFVAIGEVPVAPTFTPDGGTFTEGQTVTIECTTEGAEIYYTLDGSVPTASNTKYTDPVSVTESATLKAVAIKDGLSSTVTSADFTINLSETEKTGFYSDDITLSEATLDTIVTQKTAVKDGKQDVRFIQKVNGGDLSGKSKAIFTLTSSEEGKTPRTVSTRKYYTGLTFDDGTKATAAGGQVFLCYTVKDVPAGVTVEATAISLE